MAIWSDALGPIIVVGSIAIPCVGTNMIFKSVIARKPVPTLAYILSFHTHGVLWDHDPIYEPDARSISLVN